MTDGLMEVWRSYKDKHIFVELSNRRKYSGTVLLVEDDFMIINDKFGNKVTIQYKFIVTIEEQPNKYRMDGRYGNKI